MTLRKTLLTSLLAFAAAGSLVAQDASVFYSYQTTATSPYTFTADHVGLEGFASASVITENGGAATSKTNGAEFIYKGTTWNGGTTAYGLETQGGASYTFSLTLDTTGFKDLAVRMDVRVAGTGFANFNSFSSFTYDIGGGAVEITEGISNFAGTGSYNEWSADLSSIGAIANQGAVTLTWTVNGLDVGNTSFRTDNLLITATAIPEPSTYAALFGVVALGAVVIRRRKAARQ